MTPVEIGKISVDELVNRLGPGQLIPFLDGYIYFTRDATYRLRRVTWYRRLLNWIRRIIREELERARKAEHA